MLEAFLLNAWGDSSIESFTPSGCHGVHFDDECKKSSSGGVT